MSTIVFLVCLSSAAAFNTDFSDQAWTSKPIAKVIGLLEDMSKQLEAEAKADADMYAEMGCWCTSNEKEKTAAIKAANKKIPECEAAIEKFTALSSQLDTEIKKLNKEIAKETSGLEQATALRTKENSEFSENEKDMTATISSLGGAVEALGKSQGAALVQVRKTIAGHMQKHAKVLQSVLTPKQRSDMKSFVQVSSDKPGPAASGAIFGTLKQMKESFETNLADAQTEEKTAAAQYAALKDAKDTQLAAMAKQVEDKTVEMADSNEKNAETKTDLEETSAQLAADTEFLANVKDMCATADADYAARSKVRGDEIAAVGEAIGILTEDESKDAYGASGHLGFIQISAHRHRTNRKKQQQEAARILRKTGKVSHNPQLLQLAVSVQGPADAMKMVQDQMDGLIAELKKTQKEEVAKKDYCDSEIHTNEMETTAAEEKKADTETLIKTLGSTIETLGDEIEALKLSIATMQGELKKASVDRIAESQEFQKTVNEQRATQTVLQKALDRLNEFYASKAAFLQQKKNSKAMGKQTPPAQATYQKSAGSSSALSMLEHIIEESKDVEAKATKAETEAITAYTTFVADSNAAITASQESVATKTGEIAKSDKAMVDAKADLTSIIDDLLVLGEASATLHQDCDFLLKHFTERQESRSSEIEGIQAAKAVLGGAKMFLQK